MNMRPKSFTFGAFKEIVLKLLERYSSNGMTNSCGEVKDIEKRLVQSLNVHQRQLFSDFCPITKKQKCVFLYPEFSYSLKDIRLSQNECYVEEVAEKSPAIRIECSGKGIIRVMYDDTVKAYEIDTKTGEVETICFSVNSARDNKIQLEFQATESLFVNSVDVFKNYYGTQEEIEWFCQKDRCTLRLPENFRSVVDIYDKNGNEVPQEIFEISAEKNTISTDMKNAGTYLLEYYTYPEEICEEPEDSVEINLPAGLFDALCYMCASDVCPACDGEMYSKLTYKYREILENFYDKKRQLARGRNSFYTLCGRILPNGRKTR